MLLSRRRSRRGAKQWCRMEPLFEEDATPRKNPVRLQRHLPADGNVRHQRSQLPGAAAFGRYRRRRANLLPAAQRCDKSRRHKRRTQPHETVWAVPLPRWCILTHSRFASSRQARNSPRRRQHEIPPRRNFAKLVHYSSSQSLYLLRSGPARRALHRAAHGVVARLEMHRFQADPTGPLGQSVLRVYPPRGPPESISLALAAGRSLRSILDEG